MQRQGVHIPAAPEPPARRRDRHFASRSRAGTEGNRLVRLRGLRTDGRQSFRSQDAARGCDTHQLRLRPAHQPIFGTPEMHTGVDIAAPLGTPIHAAADGVISIAWLCGGYGNYVRIRHGDGIATGYAHASRFAKGIYSGARVTAGQIIADVGSTGLSTGPHLHFEVLVKGQPVRPACACMLTGP